MTRDIRLLWLSPRPVTLTPSPIGKLLTVKLSLYLFGWDSNTQPSACGLSFYLLFGANTLTGFITTAAGNWPARSSVYFRLSFFVLVSPSGFEYQCDFGELTLGNLRLLCLYTRSLSLKRQNQICRINFTTLLTKSSSEILNFLGGYKCKIYNMTTSCHIVNVVYMTKIRRI